MTGLGWGLRSLGRHPLRTALALAGIAVAAAMLLDMVMLSGGIDKSFSELLLARGYQIRITPKGTLPVRHRGHDRRCDRPGARPPRRDPGCAAAGAVLGTSVYGRTADSLVTLFGYGVQPEAQGAYQRDRRRRPRARRHARCAAERARRPAAARGRRRHRRARGPARPADRGTASTRPPARGARRWSAGSTTTAASPRWAPCCPSCSDSMGARPPTRPRSCS